MHAGYSGKALVEKLGISNGMKIQLINAPADYEILLEADISGQLVKKGEIPDLVHLFAPSDKFFQAQMKHLEPFRKSNPRIVIWVSWYKKSSGMPTDLSEDNIRNYALQHDLVEIKVCAVSEIWSGLKLMVPKSKR